MNGSVIASVLLAGMLAFGQAYVPPLTGEGELVFTVEDDADQEDLLSRSGATEDDLRAALPASMADCAGAFVRAERETGVNAVWLAAIAALESGWGRSEMAEQKNNLFGWTGRDGYMAFESRDACIRHVAAVLAVRYLDPAGDLYEGGTVEDVAVHYCPEGSSWAATVREIKSMIEQKMHEQEEVV